LYNTELEVVIYMNGNLHMEQKHTSGNSALCISTPTIISALDQTRENYYSFAKHIHKSIEIYLITSGCCSMDINRQKVICKAGDFVLIPPNTVHSFYLETEDPCTFRHIHFDPAPFYQWLLNAAEPYPLDLVTALIFSCDSHFYFSSNEKITALVSAIIEETAAGRTASAALTNLYLAELMLFLIEQVPSRLPVLPDSGAHTPEQIRYVSYALSYIHENYAGKILIRDIAEHLNISTRYLSKVFFQHMNLTILNYINIYRINQAIDLMTHTNLTLTTIATQIGLKDSQHFSRLFHTIIGISPNRYRKLLLHDMEDTLSDGNFKIKL